jgi:hypothetical protein
MKSTNNGAEGSEEQKKLQTSQIIYDILLMHY